MTDSSGTDSVLCGLPMMRPRYYLALHNVATENPQASRALFPGQLSHFCSVRRKLNETGAQRPGWPGTGSGCNSHGSADWYIYQPRSPKGCLRELAGLIKFGLFTRIDAELWLFLRSAKGEIDTIATIIMLFDMRRNVAMSLGMWHLSQSHF